jgi:hypothetical protein
MSKPATFLLQFQEKHPVATAPDLSCGTQTRTATMEDADQDPRGLAPMFAGTATHTLTTEDPDQDPRGLAPTIAGTSTFTETSETPDQDPQLMATKTATQTSESSDQDATIRSYFAIPRAECSSS